MAASKNIDQQLPELERIKLIKEAIHDKVEEIRRFKKNHFWMKTGTMKLSTVHSFKGWEIDTLILLIEKEDEGREFTNAELVYTGITRARRNLIIFNLGNETFDDFFQKEIEIKYEVQATAAGNIS